MPTSKSTIKHYKKVAITTGDAKGIGFEVASRALHDLGPQPKTVFILYRDHQRERLQPRYLKLLDEKFLRLTFNETEAALGFLDSLIEARAVPKNLLLDLSLKSNAATWIVDVFTACAQKKITSVVTGPLSKTLIKKSGYSFIGHTGALRKLFPKRDLHMAFVGENFNVLLASDHLPLAKVPSFLNKKNIDSAISSAMQFKKMLNSTKKIAVLGLNPHAGESGLLGNFEQHLRLKRFRDLKGPLVPDAAFLKSNWKKFCIFICLYHDQGLIPFKMIHGQDSGVHVTIGLPFVRTSVDHGTAFDLYNKNRANYASMLDAIRFNLKLLRGVDV